MPPSSHLLQSRLVAASPVYFGWPVAWAATVAMGLTLPGQTAGVSLFIDRFITDLGLTRATVSMAYTVATVLAALTLPWTGRLLDRYGPRKGVVAIAVLFGVACASMGLVQGLATLFVGFFLLRALGQGALSLASIHVVNLWFVRRRGLAVGLMGLGLAFTTAFLLPLVETGIEALGWRTTYAVLGAGLLAILLPIGGLLFRRHPERYGLVPDGSGAMWEDAPIEQAFTLAEARRTGIFWILVAGLASMSLIGTGLLFHHIALMEANELSRAAAASLFVPLGLATAAASLGAGVLIDRLGPTWVLGGSLGLFALTTAAIPLVQTEAAVWVYGAAFGITQGAQVNLGGSAFAYYFGRTHIGAIKGFTKMLFVGGTALGPPLIVLGEAVFGSYAGALWCLAAAPLILALLAVFTRSPARSAAAQG